MTIQFQKILLPTDFSEHSAAAADYACDFAEKFNAELHLFHTLEIYPGATPDFGMGLALPRYATEPKSAAEKALAKLLDPQWRSNHKVVHAVREGSPKAEIVRYARQEGIGLIVLSTHGRTGLAHALMGSVAESVVRMAPCPVLTVRPQGLEFVMP